MPEAVLGAHNSAEMNVGKLLELRIRELHSLDDWRSGTKATAKSLVTDALGSRFEPLLLPREADLRSLRVTTRQERPDGQRRRVRMRGPVGLWLPAAVGLLLRKNALVDLIP